MSLVVELAGNPRVCVRGPAGKFSVVPVDALAAGVASSVTAGPVPSPLRSAASSRRRTCPPAALAIDPRSPAAAAILASRLPRPCRPASPSTHHPPKGTADAAPSRLTSIEILRAPRTRCPPTSPPRPDLPCRDRPAACWPSATGAAGPWRWRAEAVPRTSALGGGDEMRAYRGAPALLSTSRCAAQLRHARCLQLLHRWRPEHARVALGQPNAAPRAKELGAKGNGAVLAGARARTGGSSSAAANPE